jgi:Fe-S oxidoreductase
VILWDDTFVRYHEPHIGIAAFKVLEALGFAVSLPKGRRCCGRPAFSQGNLDEAARLGAHNLRLLAAADPDVPIVFLEPSCYSMFIEDYGELKLENAGAIAERCFLFEKFVDDILAEEPNALRFREAVEPVAIHAHCHAKALMKPGFMATLAKRLPGRDVTLLETGCCGMAGAFGALESKYKVSLQVGGTSCARSLRNRRTPRSSHRAPAAAIRSSISRRSTRSTWPSCSPTRSLKCGWRRRTLQIPPGDVSR